MSRSDDFDQGAQRSAVGRKTMLRAKSSDGRHIPLSGTIMDESDTHLSVLVSRRSGPITVRVPKSAILHREDAAPRNRNSRRPEERDQARNDLLARIGEEWARPPEGANRSDINHLIKTGQVESRVQEEFDKQQGKHSSWHFGGAGVVKRRRMYLRKPTQ